jgi:RNA polymerase sigma-70 factor (ECF subfamily)
LRDAFDYSSEEAAETLDMSEGAVRIALHRARKAMADYDDSRALAKSDRSAEVDAMLSRMLVCIARRDLEEARRIFASDAVAVGDGGGVYHAGRRRVAGAERILNLYNNLARRASHDANVEVRTLNGQPAIIGTDPNPRKPNSPRWAFLIDLDAEGRIRRLYSVIAPAKLAAIAWPPGARV